MLHALNDLTLELTNKCFQNCSYCSSSSSHEDNVRLSFDTVIRVLDDFASLGGRIVELSGGEPLVYEKINETIDCAKERGFQIHLFTSANLPNQEINSDALKKVDRIYVNLQAPNRMIHDHLTGIPGSFNQTVNFIRECKTEGKWVGTHLVPLPMNIDEIGEYVELARLLKLDGISLLRFVKQGRGKRNTMSLNNDEILHLFSEVEKYREIKDLQFKVGCPLDFGFIFRRERSATPCLSGITRCVIRPNGNVIPCPAFKDAKSFVAGNVNHGSLKDIWQESYIFKQMRDFSPEKLRGFCSSCSFLTICKGRCHAQRYYPYGDIYMGPDPYCPLSLLRPK